MLYENSRCVAIEGILACFERFPVIALINNNSEPEVERAVIVEELAYVMTVSLELNPAGLLCEILRRQSAHL